MEILGQMGMGEWHKECSFCPFNERHETYYMKIGSKSEFQFESMNSQ